MKKPALYLTLFSVLAVSCSPRPVFRLTPQADNTTFNQGAEYVHFDNEAIGLTISYYKHLNDTYVMDVEIVNNSDSVLRVDPTQFAYDAYESMSGNAPRESDEIHAHRSAVNPEQELIRKDMQIARKEADQKTSTLLFAIGQTASVAQSAMEEDPKEREALSEQRQENRINYEINKQERRYEKQQLRDSREVWEIDAIRTTDLYPGEYIRGYVFFPNEPDALAYVITYNHEKATFEVLYRQQKYGGEN